jgi:hydrogenase maturation protein HypF
MLGREMILRRARGYAPLPITMNSQLSTLNSQPILAVGAHLKNSVALAVGESMFSSASTSAIWKRSRQTMPSAASSPILKSFTKRNRKLSPPICTRIISRPNLQRIPKNVRHRLASSITSRTSCLAWPKMKSRTARARCFVGRHRPRFGRHDLGRRIFSDCRKRCERVAHLRPFRLPGGDKAVREPRRAAIGLLYELFGDTAFEMKSSAAVQGNFVHRIQRAERNAATQIELAADFQRRPPV